MISDYVYSRTCVFVTPAEKSYRDYCRRSIQLACNSGTRFLFKLLEFNSQTPFKCEKTYWATDSESGSKEIQLSLKQCRGSATAWSRYANKTLYLDERYPSTSFRSADPRSASTHDHRDFSSSLSKALRYGTAVNAT